MAGEGSKRSAAHTNEGPEFDVRSPSLDGARRTQRACGLQRSGKAVSVFAAEHGLDPQCLYSWRCRLGKAERTTFTELIVRPPPGISVTDGDAAFEIGLPAGGGVRVPASFSTAALERLLEVLRAGGC